MPFRWTTGNTHKLAHHKWGTRSMGRAIDLVYDACKDIVAKVSLIHDKSFMLYIFDELCKELLEFNLCLKNEFKNKRLVMLNLPKLRLFP